MYACNIIKIGELNSFEKKKNNALCKSGEKHKCMSDQSKSFHLNVRICKDLSFKCLKWNNVENRIKFFNDNYVPEKSIKIY